MWSPLPERVFAFLCGLFLKLHLIEFPVSSPVWIEPLRHPYAFLTLNFASLRSVPLSLLSYVLVFVLHCSPRLVHFHVSSPLKCNPCRHPSTLSLLPYTSQTSVSFLLLSSVFLLVLLYSPHLAQFCMSYPIVIHRNRQTNKFLMK